MVRTKSLWNQGGIALTAKLGAFVLLSTLFSVSNINFVSASPSSNDCNTLKYSPGWVSAENSKMGNDNWEEPSNSDKSGTSGWFDETSVACGATVGLHLSGNDRPVTVKIFRMGYYQGSYARLVYSKNIGKVSRASAPAIARDATHLTSTNWATSVTIKIDSSYPTGIYMARFDDGGKAGYAPLVVRNDSPTPGLLIVAGDLTWQAYNTWGGYSLYHGPKGDSSPGRAVSFNRPYDKEGKSNFTIYDAGILQTAESLGLEVNYTDDVYLSSNPSSILGHNAVAYDGHTEYWSANMLSAATEARDTGVNLLFFGANSAYWKTRLENEGRTVVVWKGSAGDPYTNNPVMVTDKWGMGVNPFNQSQLLGALYGGILKEPAAYTVQDATIWPIKDTGLKNGDTIKGVVGKEVESTDFGQAPALQSFLSSTVTPVEFHKGTRQVGLIYYTVASHAGVVNVSTMGWVCNITDTCSWKSTADGKTKNAVVAITKQILLAAVAGPLGLQHPMVANIPARTTFRQICISVCSSDDVSSPGADKN